MIVGIGVGVAAVVLLAVAVAYRKAYAAWPPSAPERIEHCGRRFLLSSTPARGIPSGMELRSIGRVPPLVGHEYFAVRRQDDASRCSLGDLVRRTGSGRYAEYVLSGGP